jgi:hypothetical protein
MEFQRSRDRSNISEQARTTATAGLSRVLRLLSEPSTSLDQLMRGGSGQGDQIDLIRVDALWLAPSLPAYPAIRDVRRPPDRRLLGRRPGARPR